MKVRIIKEEDKNKNIRLPSNNINTVSEETDKRNYITCKALFGLGITSVTDLIKLCYKYKAIKESGISYYTANTSTFNKKSRIQLFDSLTEFFRFNKYITKDHVVVISDVVTILKEIDHLVPLDYDQNRSFEFNFKTPDVLLIARAIKNKTTVESKIRSVDNLGYHISRVKNTGPLIAAFIALISNLPFDSRTVLRKALYKFFSAKKANPEIIVDTIDKLKKSFSIKDEANKFIEEFGKEHKEYYLSVNFMINNPKAVAQTVANKFNVDAYTLTYFRKMIRSIDIVNHRNVKSNVEVVG